MYVRFKRMGKRNRGFQHYLTKCFLKESNLVINNTWIQVSIIRSVSSKDSTLLEKPVNSFESNCWFDRKVIKNANPRAPE